MNWLKSRHWAALGALVTVGTIAFDPFLQAVLSNYGQMDTVATSNDAMIGQSLRIDSGAIMPMRAGGAAVDRATMVKYLMSTGSRPDFGFISSVYNGFQNTSTFRNDAIGAECSTGHCTWPVFSSAAVCSSCENVSGQMQYIRRYGSKGTISLSRARPKVTSRMNLSPSIYHMATSETTSGLSIMSSQGKRTHRGRT